MNSPNRIPHAAAASPCLPVARTLSTKAIQENTNLDFLRAFAVLLVFVGHLSYFHNVIALGPLNLFLMGQLGVLFFFVHTCMVLMLSLERQWKDQGGKKFSVEFMIRRCFRIYPLSIAAVVLVVAFQLPLTGLRPGHLSVFRPDGGDVISNLFLVQNLTHRVSVLGPMWSLPYEMQMYLFLPWLFLLVCPNRSIGRIAAVWAFSIALGLVVMRHMPNPNLALFAPCFLPGVIAYQLQRKMRLRMPAFLWPPAVAALAAFFLAGASEENWPKKWAICLLLGLGIPIFSQLSARWFVMANHFIAKYSYGIYLTHFFCIWFAFERLAGLPAPERIIAFLLLAVGLPVLFYHAVEQPMIQVGKKLANTYAKAAHSPGAVAPMLAEPNVASPHY